MAVIHYAGKGYQSEPGESVLDTLLRNHVDLSHGCRAGACQSCMLKADPGSVPEQAQSGLKDTLKAQGYFLACSCIPEQDITIHSAAEIATQGAVVKRIVALSEEVVGLELVPDDRLDYKPGQFINIHKEAGVVRSYSLASVPAIDDELKLHIRQIPGGKVSGWVADELQPGDKVEIDGPHGDCFYSGSDKQQPLLLIGTGTGLAPLYGILRDALHQGHQGDIYLFHGSRHKEGLYLRSELKAFAEMRDNFHYTAALSAETLPGVEAGRVVDLALQKFPSLAGFRVFLCGNPEMVQQAKKKSFLAGANMNEIHADPFTPA